jgi:uncharacterized protein (TIGR03083 family)
VDAIEEWTNGQQRVLALTENLSPQQAGTKVPACPDWTVRQLLSHMIGLNADVLAGNEPDDHNATWTQAQVDRQADQGVPDLTAEWRTMTEPMRDWMSHNGTRPMADLLIHEQDLRGALGVPGAKDTEGLAALRDRFVGRLAAGLADLPPLALQAPNWQWTNTGTTADAAVVVTASNFELTRAVLARRSANQLRQWTTKGDITPYLPAFATLGDLPAHDLTE